MERRVLCCAPVKKMCVLCCALAKERLCLALCIVEGKVCPVLYVGEGKMCLVFCIVDGKMRPALHMERHGIHLSRLGSALIKMPLAGKRHD